ncbi:MAG: hypothetical protein C4555_04860 [Dehalococcoidia bacterium]|jgi:inhibitor of cysteine peptidase|nr:MAG: hypothetical protein C4555_04860 [Dehalococcoidia bacterium]
MKKRITLTLATLLLLPVLVLGCGSNEPATPEVPPLNGGEPAKTLELTDDDFTAQAHIIKDIELTRPGSLIVSLYANPSTGFSWAESANITPAGVIEQVSHEYVTPGTDAVGAGGKDVWVFDSKETGSAAIGFSYSRPWEGGEKDVWTVTLNVTVK